MLIVEFKIEIVKQARDALSRRPTYLPNERRKSFIDSEAPYAAPVLFLRAPLRGSCSAERGVASALEVDDDPADCLQVRPRVVLGVNP